MTDMTEEQRVALARTLHASIIELQRMAESGGMQTLVYTLSLAAEEANGLAQGFAGTSQIRPRR